MAISSLNQMDCDFLAIRVDNKYHPEGEYSTSSRRDTLQF
jgi:hypothetical protein